MFRNSSASGIGALLSFEAEGLVDDHHIFFVAQESGYISISLLLAFKMD